MDKKTKISVITIGIITVITLVIGLSYAYWSTTKIQESTNLIATSCLDLTIVNEENAINLEKAYPISDEEGARLTPFKITIKNTCSSIIEYQANLEVLGNTTLDSQYLAIKVDNNDKVLLNTLDSDVETTIENAKEGRKLATGVLGPNEWYTHSIRIWMDKDVEYIEATINKLFESKVVITGKAIAEDTDDYKITGTITENNENKTPLSNKDIIIKDYNNKEYNTTTDNEGNFSIEVPRGGYDLYYENTKIGSVATNGGSINNGNDYLIVSITTTNTSNIPKYILKATKEDDQTAFWSSTYKGKIKNITIENKINIPATVTEDEKWDISENEDGSIISYVVPSETAGYYDLYIQSNGKMLGNEDMSHWFEDFYSVETISGLNLIDTSKVTNMSHMFDDTGYKSTNFPLDLGEKFDTSKVTNMNSMFYGTGKTSPNFTLNLGNKFDTSKVTDMSNMFYGTGYSSTKLNTTITIKTPKSIYWDMFYETAVQTGSKITVNYTAETSNLVDKMIATKSENGNVVKGVQVN